MRKIEITGLKPCDGDDGLFIAHRNHILLPRGNITVTQLKQAIEDYTDHKVNKIVVSKERAGNDVLTEQDTADGVKYYIEVQSVVKTHQVTTNTHQDNVITKKRPLLPVCLVLGGGAGSILGALASTAVFISMDMDANLVFGIGVPSGLVIGLLVAGFGYAQTEPDSQVPLPL